MTVSTRQQRIAENARAHPERSFTSLAHHLDRQWLLEAWYQVRKDGAVGVDGETAAEFEADLMTSLERLREGATQGATAPRRCAASTSPKATGKRHAQSASRPYPTRSSSARWR